MNEKSLQWKYYDIFHEIHLNYTMLSMYDKSHEKIII